MAKSPDAFRTISEVADWLDVQAHVLRFWESKFSQVKPIKRAGGRRYYRPADMLLLGGIKKLLHDDGLTIKGVQKILREEGMGHVSALSAPLDEQLANMIEAMQPPQKSVVEEETAVVLDFSSAATEDAEDASAAAEQSEDASDLPAFVHKPLDATPQTAQSDNLPAAEKSAEDVMAEVVETSGAAHPKSAEDTTEGVDASDTDEAPQTDDAEKAETEEPAENEKDITAADATESTPEPDAEAQDPGAQAPEPQVADAPPAPKPRIINIPPFTPEAEFAAAPSALTAAFCSPGLTAAQARDVAPLLQQLTALRDRMHSARRGGAPKG